MSVVGTLVVNFGESAASSSGSVVAEWDDSLNVDNSGEVKSRFVPGDEAYLLVHHDPDVTIKAVKVTAGSVSGEGDVTLSREQEIGFGDADDVQTLSYLPASGVSMQWYGREGSGQNVSGKEVSMAANFPCLALAQYSVRFQRYKVQTPAMELKGEEEFPLRVYIYFEEGSK